MQVVLTSLVKTLGVILKKDGKYEEVSENSDSMMGFAT